MDPSPDGIATGGAGPSVTADADERRVPEPSHAGARTLDRFELRHRIGAGGMGEVFEAWDPTLERKVAIKLIHAERSLSASARRRLLLEAKAMARVSHPNVVHVYEAGEAGHELFIAMELVQGTTLRAWLGAQPRSPKETIVRFAAAGRGLAAAHREGIIHRDFKPENVLVDRDGLPRVADFGLAGVFDELTTTEHDADPGSSRLTNTGAVVGTPAYMSPEQHRGEPLDPRTDQYSFCVALFEALYGRRPFVADSLPALVLAVTNDPPPPVPRIAGVSARQRRAIARGLERDAEKRFPTMDALLVELAAEPVARRSLVLAAAIVIVGGALVWTLQPAAAACEGGGERMASSWNQSTRDGLEQTLLGSGAAHAGATWERVEPLLDRFAEDWNAVWRESCEATARGEQSTDLLDRRSVCLHRALLDFDARLQLLRSGTADVVDHAIELAHDLPPLAPCSDLDALLAAKARARRDDSAEARALEESLARIAAARTARTADPEEARAAVGEARTLGTAWLEARAGILAGHVFSDAGLMDEAAAALEQARLVALREDDDALALEAMIPLVRARGVGLAKFEAALELGEVAGATGEAVGFEGTDLQARWHTAVGDVLFEAGRYADAQARFEQALSIEDASSDRADGSVQTRRRLGGALRRRGEMAAAETTIRAALQTALEVYGPDHPETALTHDHLGSVLAESGRFDEAKVEFREAIRIHRATQGETHVSLAFALNNLGNAMLLSGDEEAHAVLEEALVAARRYLAPDHPMIAGVLSSLGGAHGAAGRYAEAEASLAESIRILDARLGDEHGDLAMPRINLGRVVRLAGRPAEAVPILEAAVAAAEQGLGGTHDRVAMALTELATARLEAGDRAGAIEAAERAVSIRSGGESSPRSRAWSELALGRALWEEDEARALVLVRSARDRLAATGDPPEHNEAAQWLRERAR